VQEVENLTGRLEALENSARELAAAMRDAAAGLENGSLGLALGLPERIQQLSQDYWALSREIQELARQHGVQFDPPTGMRDLAVLLGRVQEKIESSRREAWQQARDRVLSTLEKVGRLVHREGVRLDALEKVKQTARALEAQIRQSEWPATPPEQAELESGQHPLVALLRLVEEGDALPDQEWERLHDVVRGAYPSELVTPVVRGKLTLAEVAPPAPTPEEPGVEAAEGERAEEGEIREERALPPEVRPVERGEAEPAHGVGVIETVPGGGASVEARIEEEKEARIQEETEVAPPRQVDPILWGLIRHGHRGLAYHLARHAEQRADMAGPAAPAWLLRAAALGPALCAPDGQIASLLQQDLDRFSDECFQSKSSEVNWALRFLLIAAGLRPAILAPQTGAAAVLRQLHLGELPSLFQYCQEVAAFGERNYRVTPAVLRGVRDRAAWQQELDRLRAEASDWWAQAPTFTTKYAPATKVWRAWLQKGQWIEELMRPVLENDEKAASTVEGWLDRMRTDKGIDKAIQQTDRNFLRRLAGREITADARDQLRCRAREALQFARRWLELIEEKQQSGQRDYITSAVQDLRTGVMDLTGAALAEIRQLVENNPGQLPMEACAPICVSALENVRQMFDPRGAVTDSEPPIEDLLHIELFHVPGVQVRVDWEVRWVREDDALDFVGKLAEGYQPQWQDTFDRFCGEGDHRSTARILAYLERIGQLGVVEELERIRAKSLKDWQERLDSEIRQTQLELENAVAQGLLTEELRTRHAGVIETLTAMVPEMTEFGEAFLELDKVRQSIACERQRRVEECRERMRREVLESHPFRTRIEELLEQGDVFTAQDYIDRIGRGEEVVAAEPRRDVFSEFFPDAVNRLDKELERVPVGELIRRVRERENVAGLNLEALTGKDAERAADALSKWFAAKREERCTETQARDILAFLGFQVSEVLPVPGERGRWMRLRANPLSSREHCPIPLYGSGAKGEHRVLCVWERPNEETLLQEVGDTSRLPVIVFYFGRLTEHRRRHLARVCREQRKTVLVLDDILLVYLCSVTGVRLGALFRCTLPFTYAEAYVTSAGPVPPEMFYGRARALESIRDPYGSCFIYGGRQLGKTALLCEAQRTFHNPTLGHVALWIDLKVKGVGYNLPLDELWNILDLELRNLGVLADRSGRTGADAVLSGIEKWLAGGTERRLLLLLDEADRFLAGDANDDFTRATQLKGLMDRTQRRFKVVFAGLHDVQRTTTLSNHPLAHYGTPICVGPLLEGAEWRDARALVEQPYEALGYRFAHPDLVTRILSQTNYYPSLIQLYCHELFYHLVSNPKKYHDWRHGPYYTITEQQVEEAYRSQGLRRAIRDRFLWTLQLDKRYEVIAYAMAFEISTAASDARSSLLVDGFDTAALHRLACSCWPEGFEDAKSFDAFKGLLDELVGLGVLRHAPRGRYAFRSPNVIALLGTEEEIFAKLTEPRQREPRFSPEVMRSPLSVSEQERRSPLTWQQESALHKQGGVFVIVGCRAAGLDDCPTRIGELFRGRMRLLQSHETRSDLERILRARWREGSHVVLVPPKVRWDSEWIGCAVKILQRRSSAIDLRVIFLCSASQLWDLLSKLPNGAGLALPEGSDLLTLGPWGDDAVRIWLDDIGIVANSKERQDIRKVTGYWPLLLYELRKHAGNTADWRSALEALHNKLDGDPADCITWREAFGIGRNAPGTVLHWLSLQEECAESDLIDLLQETHSPRQVQLALEWGKKLNLISYGTGERLRLDPVVQRLAGRLS